MAKYDPSATTSATSKSCKQVFWVYIVTVILTGYAKADLGKEIKDALVSRENQNTLINITEI